MRKIKRAIISVYNKKNLFKLVKTLSKFNIKLISSGGTYKQIKKYGFNCTKISKFTGFPEILDGRVKTIHPKIHAGILSKNNKKNKLELKKNKFDEIDLVIVNFYPFEENLKKTTNQNKIIENIDIGGPALVRSAAKNFSRVSVLSNSEQYDNFINEINKNHGSIDLKYRLKLSKEAFLETAYYESLISNYFNKNLRDQFPKKKIFHGKIIEKLRYGENPHQESAIYSNLDNLKTIQLSGKKLSYNNYNDIFAALSISKSFKKNLGTVIVKHGNPCGVSLEKDKLKSYKFALSCDPISAFGGIISFNFKLNIKIAKEINKKFYEVIIANGFENNALKVLKRRKNLRIIDASKLKNNTTEHIISNFNSYLIQTSDNKPLKKNDFKVVSNKKPSSKTLKNLIFTFNICRFVKSNAIVLSKNNSIVGIGSGQTSRLDSCQIAIDKMNKFQNIKNSDEILAASDAFFPFIDSVEMLVRSGVTAIIQPNGSVKDEEIINFANKTGTVLVFSKNRHFKH